MGIHLLHVLCPGGGGLSAILQAVERQGFRPAHVVATRRLDGLLVHLRVEGGSETALLRRMLARLGEVRSEGPPAG